MPICKTEEAIEEIRKGRMIILVDDEDRENEGDLTIAAQHVTPEIINFMATHGRGLICLALEPAQVDKLQLPMMTRRNGSKFGTNFTVSIEARKGVTTGISAADRATTILAAVADEAQPEDLVTPGHIFPLRAQKGGVMVRAGQTEGSVDLSRLAGLKGAAVICEIMRDDGEMARMPDLIEFAKKHDMKIATIRDLIRYRMQSGLLSVKRVAEAQMPTKYGEFRVIAYENELHDETHLALVKGDITPGEPVLVRVHSECLTGDVLGSMRCDCGGQLAAAMCQTAGEGKFFRIADDHDGTATGVEHGVAQTRCRRHPATCYFDVSTALAGQLADECGEIQHELLRRMYGKKPPKLKPGGVLPEDILLLQLAYGSDIVVGKEPVEVEQDKQPVLQLPDAADVFGFEARNDWWRRLDRAGGNAQHLRHGVDHKTDDHVIDLDDNDTRMLVMGLRVEPEAPAQVDDGYDLAPQVDDTLDELGGARDLGDFHRADDFLNLQDIHTELLFTDAERHQLEKFVILSLLGSFHTLILLARCATPMAMRHQAY